MVDLSVEIAGVRFKNPIVVGSATPTMNARQMKKGIDGGAGAVIAKSLFGEGGKLGRKFPRPRFKLYDYREYPGYPEKLPHCFTLRSLEECSSFDYETYMKDINAAKDLVGDDGVVIASLSGSSMDEWITMCQMVNETKADWVELNNSCPFAADMGVKMGSGAVDLTYQFVKACKEVIKKPFSVKITPQTNDPLALAKQVEQAGANAVNMSARLSGIMIDIETAKPVPFGAIGGWGGPYLLGLRAEDGRRGGQGAEDPHHRRSRGLGLAGHRPRTSWPGRPWSSPASASCSRATRSARNGWIRCPPGWRRRDTGASRTSRGSRFRT